jgi:inhibitor of KinA
MKIAPLGDAAVVVTLADTVDAATVAAAQALVDALEAKPLPGVIECVPANASVAVYYDPVRVPGNGGPPPYERVCQWIEDRAGAAEPGGHAAGRSLTIPVCYGGEWGPDLEAIGAAHGLSVEEVVSLHRGAEYFVSAVGFAPGFPYLGGLPERLHTPRRKSPRTRVPAGTVAIGGRQTGIYPFETPGGWNLIGRTPWRLFDPYARPPALFQLGDRVRFQSVTPAEFQSLQCQSPLPSE